ncbi:MAG TPA: MarR family transcriptional regulator [Kosmotogaceae bacterium]|nr:MAG: Transcriptional regulator [Thermotogales bacterium 46_20]HAA85243.1 MarR family transcriptional regulator [Kosmotogaceae bacterium]
MGRELSELQIAENVEHILRAISTRVRREGRKVLRDFPITPAQFDVLQILYFRGEKRMSDISDVLGITKSTTTGLVRRLMDGDFIRKHRSVKDKRSYMIKLSPSGEVLVESVIKRRVEFLHCVLKRVDSPKPQNYEKLLRELLEAMQQDTDGPNKIGGRK